MGIKHVCLQPANWFTYVCSEEKMDGTINVTKRMVLV